METTSNIEKDADKAIHFETIDIPGIAAQEVTYTDHDETRLRRKLDFWLMPILMVSYALQYWDKSLSGQAVQFNFAKDLGLIETIGYDASGKPITSSQKLANITLIFYIGYLVSAYPAALLTQRLPTAKVCAGAIFLWSIIILSTPACTNYGGLMVNRFFLGCLESCIAPTFVVYVTFWWTRPEQSLRSGLWWGMNGASLIVTPLISWGLGHINGTFGQSTWKYMYLVAGALTCLWSIIVLIVLPDNPKSAKWLSDREKSIVLARIKENNAGVVDTKFKKAQAFEALKDFNMWSNSFIVGTTGIPNAVFSSFGTLVISGFGFTALDALLLLMPVGFGAVFSVYVSGYIGQRFRNMRYYLIIANSTVALAGSLMAWLVPREKSSVLYAGVVLMTFGVGANAVSIGLTSANCAGHTKKATVSGGVFIGYCIGNIVGPLCFASTPGPIYYGGFVSCVVVNACVIILAIYGRWTLSRENQRRDREYGPPTVVHSLEDLTDRENNDFRYVI